jgi:hypothetical protein
MLYVSCNTLARMPNPPDQLNVFDCAHLQELDVSCNAVARLPKRLDACAALDYLSLAGNQLAGLPGALHLPPSLRWLDLSDNQLGGLPAAILTARQLQVCWGDRGPCGGAGDKALPGACILLVCRVQYAMVCIHCCLGWPLLHSQGLGAIVCHLFIRSCGFLCTAPCQQQVFICVSC